MRRATIEPYGALSNSYFEFKQFRVEQSGSAMKVGTDGVLIGAWARFEGNKQILDLGTGTGVIALMAAQRSCGQARIVAIDIDPDSASQAASNAALSRWSESIEVRCTALQQLTDCDGLFDHVVSNPPYFRRSLPSPDSGRTLARHDNNLPLDQIPRLCFKLLTERGLLSLIVPDNELQTVTSCARLAGFALQRVCRVSSFVDSVPIRVMCEFGKGIDCGRAESTTLAIHNPDGSYTEQYRRLTEEFYLKF